MNTSECTITEGNEFIQSPSTAISWTNTIFQVVINMFNMIFGFSTNGIVIVMFVSNRKLRTAANAFVVNLALGNILQLSLTPAVNYDLLHKHNIDSNKNNDCYVNNIWGMYGQVACIFIGSSICISCISSILFIAVISIVRYISIVHPALKNSMLKRTKVIIAAIVVWVYTGLVLIPLWVGVGQIHYHNRSRMCIMNWFYNLPYTVILFVFVFGIPMSLIAYSYARIFLIYRSSRKRIEAHTTHTIKARRQEMKLAGHLLLTFCVFAVCWLPYLIFALFVDPEGTLTPQWVYDLSRILICVNAAVSPLLYWFLNAAHRKELTSLCSGCSRKQTATKETTATNVAESVLS